MKIHHPLIAGGAGGYGEFIQISDVKAANTDGGSFASGAWKTRDLNTIDVDETGLVTLTTNQFVLPLGTYEIHATAPGKSCDLHQARLQNITASTTTLVGTSEQKPNPSNNASMSLVQGRFTISASTTYELQHQCGSTRNTDGFGQGCNFTTELYAVVQLWRIKK